MTIPSSGEGMPISILFLDLEGGFGGSSRSMFYLISNMDRTRFSPVAVIRKAGPILDRYREIGIPCYVLPQIPSFRPGRRKRPVSFVIYLFHCLRLLRVLSNLKAVIRKHGIGLIHVNHESLGLTGLILSRYFGLPWTCHIRTQLVPGVFSGFVYRVINRHAKRVVFITDQNMTHFAALVGRAFEMQKAAVIRNICPCYKDPLSPLHLLREHDGYFRVLSMSNFSHNRGVDRIIRVAEILKERGRDDFRFFLFGRPANKSLAPGKGNPYTESMRGQVKEKDLDGMVSFPGHTGEPERALAGADALIKLTREANPWGRDIMEGLMAGLPIITQGAYEGFVENGVNGYMELTYRPHRIADYLIRLRDDPALVNKIQAANREKAMRLFDGRRNALAMETLYEEVMTGRRT